MSSQWGTKRSARGGGQNGGAKRGPAVSATAITEIFGEGPKLTGVLLEYRDMVAGGELEAGCFAVAERTVTDVYTCTADDPGKRTEAGRYVMVRLSPEDPQAPLKAPPDENSRRTAASGPPQLGDRLASPRFRSPKATVAQVLPIRTVMRGLIPAADQPIVASAARTLIVEDFVQAEFHDDQTGETLKYNLFVPQGWDGSTAYPLVLFMHDAGASSEDPLTTLKQGLGAVVFAQGESQAKHPCLVLAPQYPSVVVNDASESTSALETTVNLVRKIAHEYGVDTNRLYTTGQSGGAMMSMAIDIRYPELFAASFIVAGQWGPELVAPLAIQKLWILVAAGDLKAFTGQNAITQVLEEHGAVVARADWDGRSGPRQLGLAAAELAAAGSSINYSVLRKGTVVPEGQPEESLNNHINTWRIAYTIEPIRDWLFDQRR